MFLTKLRKHCSAYLNPPQPKRFSHNKELSLQTQESNATQTSVPVKVICPGFSVCFQNPAMGGDQTCYSECRKLVENLANDISNGLDGMETEVLPKISLLKKSIGVLIDQSVSVSRAHIDKDFLTEFADVDIKTRVQTKIFNALEEEISKLKLLVNDQDMKLVKCRSAMVPLEAVTLSLKESHVNLLNALEMTKDCSQIFTYLCMKLQIATTCIKYEDISSLNKLTNFPNDIRNAKKIILEKKKAIADFLLLPMNEEEIKLVTVGN